MNTIIKLLLAHCLLWPPMVAQALESTRGCADWRDLSYVLIMDGGNTLTANIRYPDVHYAVNLRYLGDVDTGPIATKRSRFEVLSPFPDETRQGTAVTLKWEATNCWWTYFDYERAKQSKYRPLEVGETFSVWLQKTQEHWGGIASIVHPPVGLETLRAVNLELVERVEQEKIAGHLFWPLLLVPVLFLWVANKTVHWIIKAMLAVTWPIVLLWRSAALKNYYTAQTIEYGILLPFFLLWCMGLYRAFIKPSLALLIQRFKRNEAGVD